ncbi:MAG: zeta toxin family protein [bacterium]
MKQVLVILRGAPACGKSTISAQLRDMSDKIVWLKTDNFKPFFLNTGVYTDIMNKTALASLSCLLDNKYSVIYEGIFQNPLFVEAAKKVGQEKNIPVFVYQITCSLKTLQDRDLMRPGIKEGCRKPLGNEVIEKIYNTVENNPIAGAVALNTEQFSLEECLAIIRKNFE